MSCSLQLPKHSPSGLCGGLQALPVQMLMLLRLAKLSPPIVARHLLQHPDDPAKRLACSSQNAFSATSDIAATICPQLSAAMYSNVFSRPVRAAKMPFTPFRESLQAAFLAVMIALVSASSFSLRSPSAMSISNFSLIVSIGSLAFRPAVTSWFALETFAIL
jgi:hypothetical protein